MSTKFKDISKAEWLARVEKDLKGKALSSLDFEVAGRTFSPFHHREDLDELPRPISTSTECDLGVFIEVKDPVAANKRALEALIGGASYIYFYDPHYLDSGEDYKEELYKDILTDIADIVWHNSPKPFPVEGIEAISKRLLIASNDLSSNFTFWLQLSHNHLANIAYVRAVRLCANLILEETKASSNYQIGVYVAGDEADPNAAKINSTAHAIAAITGGADILMIAASDEEGASAFERRVARNVHNVLIEESHLGKVADPAAGSYYIETLTDHLAQKIWTEFQQLYREASNNGGNKSSNASNSV